VIHEGHSNDSRLIQMVKGSTGKVMPPVGGTLSGVQIATLARWVDQGAEWPASASVARHWAWEPVEHPSGAIDSFILARLEKENIAPSPEADRATLLRRVSLDITGLPPTPRRLPNFWRTTGPTPMPARSIVCSRARTTAKMGALLARSGALRGSDGFEKDLERPWSGVIATG